jgi:hypothetical protein
LCVWAVRVSLLGLYEFRLIEILLVFQMVVMTTIWKK